jgi:predicted transcriptional regulator
MMMFNGLSGSDLVIFNALAEYDLPATIPASQISNLTGYSLFTVWRALRRLENYQIICRHRESNGQPHTIEIVDDYVLPNS